MAFNPENRITWEELAPSLQELFKNLQSQITREVERARNEELRLDRKIDDEIARAKSEEKRIETKLDKEIDRSTQEDQDIHDELDGIKDLINQGGDEGGEPGGPGLIDVFVHQGREFYIHFTNGFKMVGIFTHDDGTSSVGPVFGTENNIVKPWMTGFNGFTGGGTYTTLTTTDESENMGFLDQACIIYSRGYTGTSVIMSTVELYDMGGGNVGYRRVPNSQFTFCIGY